MDCDVLVIQCKSNTILIDEQEIRYFSERMYHTKMKTGTRTRQRTHYYAAPYTHRKRAHLEEAQSKNRGSKNISHKTKLFVT